MRFCAIGVVLFILSSLAAASVSVSSPSNGSTVSGSVHVASSTTGSHAISSTVVYVDNQQVYKVDSGSVSTYLALGTGQHTLVVQSWETTGTVLKSSPIGVTVTASGPPANAKQYNNINQMGGWQGCDTCAGAGGNGPTAVYSLVQGLSSPSMDGKSSQFYLQGNAPYSAALWWNQLGANPNVSNFQYDLYFYLKQPSAAQALEFDVNQSIDGKKYIFGTECDIKGHHDWNVYDAAGHQWMQTGIACSEPAAYAWNHLTLEFQRANGQVKFLSVTLNGKKSYINRAYSPQSSSVSELNVAIQIDADGSNTPYHEWADKVNLTAW